jgi:hypothetical protein
MRLWSRVVRIRAGVLTVAITAIINQPQIEGLDNIGVMVLRYDKSHNGNCRVFDDGKILLDAAGQ